MRRARLVVSCALAAAMLFLAACAADVPPAPDATATIQRTAQPTFTPVATDAPVEGEQVSPTLAATGTPVETEPASLRMASPEYGMQAFLWWRPEVASRDIQIIRDAGFGWVKVNFGWREIEPIKGEFDWSHTDAIVTMANDEALDLLVRLDYQPQWAGGGFPLSGPPDDPQDLADFCSALASRYAGRIRAYQVWNEPNLSREWGGEVPDAAAYVDLLGLCYEAIKAADPNAMVISAGLSPTGTSSDIAQPDDTYLEEMYAAMDGNSDGYFDVLGAHGAGFLASPETDPAEVAADPSLGGHRFMAFRRVEDLRAIMVENGDEDKQVALLEFGWTSDPRPTSPYFWHAVSEEVKADYMVRAYQYAEENWSPWIGVMSLIFVANPDWTPEEEQYWWAITYPSYPEFKPRPAYEALKAMEK